MGQVITSLSPAHLWLPALVMILGTNLTVAIAGRSLSGWRWPLAAIVLLTPLTFPQAGTYSPQRWGVLDTIFTTMAIVSAARLPTLDRLFSNGTRSRAQLFFWMTVPMARFWPEDNARRANNRRRVPRLLLSAAAKRFCWEPLGYLTTLFEGDSVPWPIRSAILILYFVLNITAAADALSAFCLLLGCDIDVLFDAPLLSYSPRDFWSSRWNRFISRFALKHVALKLGKRWGSWAIILSVFATSGIFHEYFAWGVGGSGSRPGYMAVFFVIQGFAVWVGTRAPIFKVPHLVGTALTFLWMTVTAPLFFAAIEPALLAFGFPRDWLPFVELVNFVNGL